MELRGRVEVFRLLLVCWLVVGPVLAQVRHPLPALWMMPVSCGSGRENVTAAVAPAVRLALQDLKRQPPPLGNYEIQLQLLDSQCDPAKSLKALFDAMWAGPKYLLVFGGVCPSVTALIARSLPALDLVQVSFAASSPSLSNRKWYGNLFSTVPSDRALNQATVKLLQRYRWTRVGIITQEGPRLSEVMLKRHRDVHDANDDMKKDLIRQLLKADVQAVSTESLSEDVCSSVRRLKESDVRIIIGQFEEDSASEVFCCAYRLNMFGARYQWVVADGGTAGWRLGRPVSGCAANSLLMAADGSIRLQIRQLSYTNTPGVSGRTPRDYQDSYLRRLIQVGSEVSPLHTFAYDAVWVAARALSQVMEAVKHREKYSSQRNVSVSEEEVHKRLLEAVKQTQFEGVTGPVSFRNGERVTSIELIQFQGSSGVLVGEFGTATQQLRLMNHLLRFKGPGPARDRTLVLEVRRHVSLLLYGIASSAAAATIFVTLAVLCFSIVSHRRWTLRWSGGSQDELLLLLGILLSSSSVLISGLDGASLSDQTSELLCSVRLWTLSVGHTVGFAVLFTKTWRVYSQKQQTRLQRAGCVVLWMVLLDVFVLTSWQILDPLRRVVLQHSLQRDPADQDVIVRPYSEHCSSTNMELWLTAVYGYKGPLLGLGCFVAWNIRTVQVDHPAVSSKHLTLSMFAVTVFSVSGVAGSLLTSHNPPVQFCLTSVLILCCNIFILSWLFGPKFWYVWLNGSELQGEAEEQLSSLNQQLKSLTAQLDVEIETITMQLSETPESAAPDQKLHHLPREKNNGEVRSVTLTHVAQVCAEDRNSERKPTSPDGINSPEHVRRRLSLQLPILHHSYLPAIGGISASSSILFGSREAFVHRDLLTTTPCTPNGTQLEPLYC
ncbi:gamma-aminobutyric acid type B receptor subunit 2-like isoform X1 [Siniperca chuatsi]|uniref:gamma-aminobutyric acid type B receptor subunit 2-like isoform X1 n=1 Tax=Siniperca chuatsi TaxID=119488 RepID=UPI001CE1F9EF|nr:gamma-aminobutyric acid type B receptor subunit 2-like isoform X1 [Siniperca chuatsi]